MILYGEESVLLFKLALLYGSRVCQRRNKLWFMPSKKCTPWRYFV